MRRARAAFCLALTLAPVAGCGRTTPDPHATTTSAAAASSYFAGRLPPGLPPPKVPRDNPLTSRKVELGRLAAQLLHFLPGRVRLEQRVINHGRHRARGPAARVQAESRRPRLEHSLQAVRAALVQDGVARAGGARLGLPGRGEHLLGDDLDETRQFLLVHGRSRSLIFRRRRM